MGKPTDKKRELKEYRCPLCGKRDASKYAIKRHQDICEKGTYNG